MNQNQENKFSMYLVVQKVLTAHQGMWNGTPAFVTANTAFNNVINAISTAAQKQMKGSSGATLDKLDAKKAMIDKAIDIKSAVIAYASANKNNTLKEKMEKSRSDMESMRDTLIGDFCQLVYNEASPLAAQLVSYGVTAGELSALQTAINAYKALIGAPRVSIGEESSATLELDGLFGQGDALLKDQIDKLMEGFASSQLEFYARYQSGRIIVNNTGGGEVKPEVPPVG